MQTELRDLSRSTAGNLDGWISQAKRLQHDIDESKITAKHILEEGSKSHELHEKEKDAASKAELLRTELAFNETLIGALEQIQIATGLLDKAKNAEAENELVEAVKELGNAQRVVAELNGLQSSRLGGLLTRRATQIKEGLGSRVAKSWHALVSADHEARKITIKTNTEVDGVETTLANIVAAMQELGTLEAHVSRLYRELDAIIIDPRFSEAADGAVANLTTTPQDLSVSGRAESQDLATLAEDVKLLISFLKTQLPDSASDLLLARLIPNLLIQIVNDQLDPSVPVPVHDLIAYAPSLEYVQDLATFIADLGIEVPSDGDLTEWIEKLHQNWLSRRREGALNALRAASYGAVTQLKTAERVETQMVSSDDVMVAGDGQGDEWNEDWDELEEAKDEVPALDHIAGDVEDGEEAAEWGWGEDEEKKQETNKDKTTNKEDNEDDDAGDWGWGGDEDAEANAEKPERTTQQTATAAKSVPKATSHTNGPPKQKPVTQKEITLRETFQITAIPDTLLDLINAVLSDAEHISQASFPIETLRASAAALSPIPTLLLALYRATARSFYSVSAVADLLIYNDASELASRLERLLETIPEDHVLARRLPRAIESEIKSLQSFSRLAYGREMDSQRTILSDLLSATAGFEACTNPLNAREYQSAIEDVFARLKEIDAMWKDVLCESARKQSLGALLSHVIRSLITSILELASEPSGISEPESKTLKSYLDTVASLSALFEVESPDGGGAKSLVHVYTPAWLRFIYLGEILEASLADIKFLWTEGELSLEFEAGEVVELIEALFAESEHRRGAIREIRRNQAGSRMS